MPEQLVGTTLKFVEGHIYNDGTPDRLVVLCYLPTAVYAWSDEGESGVYAVPASVAREQGDL